MKKILSAILAILMISTIVIPAFAAEGTQETKVVDNTFDNYTPAPGQKAPDNWYDPYCYESDGRINKHCMSTGYGVAAYCPEYKRIFTIGALGRKKEVKTYTKEGEDNVVYQEERIVHFKPYEAICKNHVTQYLDYNHETNTGEWKLSLPADEKQWYCPYCGKFESASYINEEQHKQESAMYSHKTTGRVIYGYFCSTCDTFMACSNMSNIVGVDTFEFSRDGIIIFGGCHHKEDINNAKVYRFLTEEQRNSDFSFIFKETEMDFGDGKDERVEDLKKNGMGAIESWESEDNPHYEPKLTFWQKIVRFFTNIGLWFANLFK